MNDPARLWADPRLVYTVAAVSVALLLAALWLFGRRRRQGRQAGVICLIVSVIFHIALIFLVPLMPASPGGSSTVDPQASQDAGIDSVAFSSFDPDMLPTEAAGEDQAMVAPLPVSNLTDLLEAALPEKTNEEATGTGDGGRNGAARPGNTHRFSGRSVVAVDARDRVRFG